MSARSRALALTMGAAAVAACSVGELDATGKACPCITGFTCDVPSGICIASGAQPTSADAGTEGPAPGEPRISVSKLRAAWTTANSVHWRWEVIGDPADFSRYEMVTGASAEAVTARAPGTRVWRPTDNSELGNMRGLDRTLDGDPLDPFTTTDEHAPGTTVFAQVHGFDMAGASIASNVVEAKTTNPKTNVVLFADADMGGSSSPASFTRSTDRPYRGTHCYVMPVDCGGAMSCYQRPERSRITVNATTLIQPRFPDAFLEFAVAGDTAVPTFYSEVLLHIGNDACPGGANACRYRWEGWTFSGADRWRLIQVPLRVLRRVSNDKDMTWEDLNAARGLLHAISFRGTWAGATTARFDEIRLRF